MNYEDFRDWLYQLKKSWPYLVALSALFLLYHKSVIDLKNEQLQSKDRHIDILKEQVKSAENHAKQLSDILPLSKSITNVHERLNALEQKIPLLAFSTQIFPTTGRMSIGSSWPTGTLLTNYISEARKYISQKQFDRALEKAEEMQGLLPGFLGSTYIRYLVEKEKGYEGEAAKYAKELITKTPNDVQINDPGIIDANIKGVYKYLIEFLLKNNNKKEAEHFAARALFLWQNSPDGSEWKNLFQANFGYLPSPKP